MSERKVFIINEGATLTEPRLKKELSPSELLPSVSEAVPSTSGDLEAPTVIGSKQRISFELDLFKKTIFEKLLNKFGINENTNPSEFNIPELEAKTKEYIQGFLDGYKGNHYEAPKELERTNCTFCEGYIEGQKFAETYPRTPCSPKQIIGLSLLKLLEQDNH